METKLILDVLDRKRKKILPLLKEFKNEFYLAGGTALALQIGHRKSIDFDFFAKGTFSVKKLQEEAEILFKEYDPSIIQLDQDTLTILFKNEIKISFFNIEDKVLLPLKDTEWFQLCEEIEIACMKIAALLRATYRDYVDLYFLLKRHNLKEIFLLCEKKYTLFEKSVYLKALLSYEDIEIVPINYLTGKEKNPREIFSFLETQTKSYLKNFK